MDGQELKEQRIKLGIVRRNFAVLLGVTTDKVYAWETGKTKLPPDLKQRVEYIENRLDKRKTDY